MKKNQWVVDQKWAGERLDIYLAGQLADLSRSAIAKHIKGGGVLVNGKAASVHKFLKEEDEINWQEANVEAKKEAKKTAKKWKFKDMIVEEGKGWIAVNKPAGLIVHPDTKTTEGTLADLAVGYDKNIAKVGEDPRRPGIVHRLDKEVSGLMLIAKTQDAFDELKRQFASRETKKTYLALVYGKPPKEEGEIKFRIGRAADGKRMAALPENSEDGKAAWTHYKVLKHFDNRTSLVEMDIFSGRTHQIRAHMFALDCPVVGDPLYKVRAYKRLPSERLMLQSVKLTFKEPKTGETKTIEIEPIDELKP